MSGVSESVMVIVRGVDVFDGTLKDLEDEWAPDSVPLTVAMGDLGRVFVEQIPNLSLADLVRVFERLENGLRVGSSAEKDAIATGFLEAVASVLDQYPDRKWILEYAGEESRQYLKEWDGFCGVMP